MAKRVVLIGGPYNGQRRSLKGNPSYVKFDNPAGGCPCWYRRMDDGKYIYAGNHSSRPS